MNCFVSPEENDGSFERGDDELSALVVINLFALEGWHVAEALGVPCVVASPTLVPYTPPSSFARRFEQAYPGLYRRLLDQEDGAPASWREVEHWLWPMFTERWGQWRSERLHLDEVPFLSADGMTQRSQTKVLYGCSPSIILTPGYWPNTIQVCGSWFPPDDWEADVQVPSHLLQDFFGVPEKTGGVDSCSAGSVVAIALSTVFDMGLFGGADEAKTVIRVLRDALKTSGMKGIFVISDHDSCLASAWNSLYSHGKKRKLGDDDAERNWVGGDEIVQGYVGSIPFQQLFPMCIGTLHHGGSGTTAAALQAGVPQILCPCVFDQFFWAERMSWLGVSPAPIKSSDFFNGDVASTQKKLLEAFDYLIRADTRKCAKNLQERILSERVDAVHTAVDALEGAVSRRVISRRQCPSNDVGVKMLELPNGLNVACTVKSEALFLFNEMDTYFRHISPVEDGCIIDVGANIGMFLLATNEWLSRHGDRDGGAPPRARLYVAIEPIEKNAQCFKQNLVLHEASAGVELHCCGLMDNIHAAEGSMDITYYPNMPGNSTFHPKEKVDLQQHNMKPELFVGAEVMKCPVTTLSALLDEYHPDIKKIDVLKVDTEGAELEVLNGISDEYWKIIRQVVVEVHNVNNRVDKIMRLLQSKEFVGTTAEAQEFDSRVWLVWGVRNKKEHEVQN